MERSQGKLNLTTVAKVARESGVSAGALRKALKEASVQPIEVKAGCSYYDTVKTGDVVRKLKKA